MDIAFAWQSGHRPVQRGITYGLDGAFPDTLQPVLLRVLTGVAPFYLISPRRFLSAVTGTLLNSSFQGYNNQKYSRNSRNHCSNLPAAFQHRSCCLQCSNLSRRHLGILRRA
ncbi:hypothetical protein P152DRAFT_228565 [Eremomyces bilateralis CBS 781.70]|uniref:Uncharacterized protein n=1 Tax=Eremomyces bilateralis CBS 781.70 TaxID=1392243 RepID=A0A6G1FRA8_9PEZI|nr:uncharacterized protein P152DRAFT_228565 [Eremomyces bilateralis CBS 781.70]KAF1808266.1 hypothetical protein P152DRAFT_228565 [Eremomyces bilateralis CBS 781.70]